MFNRYLKHNILVFILLYLCLFAQKATSQDIKVSAISLPKVESAFGPFFHQNDLYFCALNTKKISLEGSGDAKFLDLFKVPMKQANKIAENPEKLAGVINSKYNEGPLWISEDGLHLYYSKNLLNKEYLEGDVNVFKLGIFEADRKGDGWEKPVAFPFNSDSFNIAHPTLNKEETIMVFTSDLSGGYGKTDLYMSMKKEGVWQKPVNLGSSVNSEGSDTFPFWKNNVLYFASDRIGGLGGLDIYRTVYNPDNGSWSKIDRLEKPLNTEFDDFGICIKDTRTGYFTSNRTGVDKIYYYDRKNPMPDVFTLQDVNFCYLFRDVVLPPDSLGLEFEWDMGDGNLKKGLEVEHCYADTGKYIASLTIHEIYPDRYYNDAATYEVVIENNNLPIIKVEDVKDGYQCRLDFRYTDKKYDKHYWIVDGEKKFEESVKISFLSEGKLKVVLWNKGNEEESLGLELKVTE